MNLLFDKVNTAPQFVFKFGSNEVIEDLDQATDKLLQLNLPEVHNDNKAHKACFIPDTFFNKIPMAVDRVKFEVTFILYLV